MRKTGQAVIVEGYTDALMAHQAGFDNVVASLGTALTPGQVALLTRYAKRIALAYDVDSAGQKAGTFGAQALQSLIGQLAATESGIELDEVRVVRLPDGKDPDEVLRETPDRWREEVRTAQPIVEYLVDTYAKAYDLKTPGGKARFVDALMPTIRAVPNPVMRDAYLQLVHRASGVEERVLLEVLRGARLGGASGLAPGVRPGRWRRASPARHPTARLAHSTPRRSSAAADSLPVERDPPRRPAAGGGVPAPAPARARDPAPGRRLDRPGPAAEHGRAGAVPRRRARPRAERRGRAPAVQPDRARQPRSIPRRRRSPRRSSRGATRTRASCRRRSSPTSSTA